MERSLKGKVCLVTGATGGVGQAVVSRLRAERASVFGAHTGRRVQSGPPVNGWTSMAADLTDEASVRGLFDDVIQRAGAIHVVVHTVGGFSATGPLAETAFGDWERMMTLNLRSAFLCTREALRRMQGAPYGRIILFGAMSGIAIPVGRAAYGIAKAGVHMLAEAASREIQGSGLTVTVIAPGIIDTAENRASMPDARHSEWVSTTLIADTIIWLCDPDNRCSGTVIRLPGGISTG